jgi:hypothetical protein
MNELMRTLGNGVGELPSGVACLSTSSRDELHDMMRQCTVDPSEPHITRVSCLSCTGGMSHYWFGLPGSVEAETSL